MIVGRLESHPPFSRTAHRGHSQTRSFAMRVTVADGPQCRCEVAGIRKVGLATTGAVPWCCPDSSMVGSLGTTEPQFGGARRHFRCPWRRKLSSTAPAPTNDSTACGHMNARKSPATESLSLEFGEPRPDLGCRNAEPRNRSVRVHRGGARSLPHLWRPKILGEAARINFDRERIGTLDF